MKRVVWLVWLGMLAACRDAPSTILLELRAEAGVMPLDEIRLTVLVPSGVAVSAQRLPAAGAPTLPGEVVLYPRESGVVRLWARGLRGGAGVGDGATQVTAEPGKQVRATLTLKAGALPDTDRDGIPDAVDNCPSHPNPKQDPCTPGDLGLDRAPSDRGLDAPPDLGRAEATDRGTDLPRSDGKADAKRDGPKPDVKRDGPKPDLPKPDAPKPKLDLKADTRPPDTRPPDARPPDTRPPDTRPPDTRPPDTAPAVGWHYRVAVQITNANVSPLTNYPIVVTLAGNFAYGHARSDGADLRFSTSSAGAGPFNLAHWAESWSSGGTSKIWVRVSSIPAGSSTIYLFYGNPAASSTSSQSAVFPGRFVSTGNLSLTGAQSYDWFELSVGHTLTVTSGQPLAITARKIVIKGTIAGIGAGYAGGAAGTGVGAGPGGGQSVSTSGSGGGGHGGAGGAGGYDGTGPIAAGGIANGSAMTQAIDMGSGGGGNNTVGGAGGGALTLRARDLELAGAVNLAGADVTAGGTSGQCAGGGAGGGLLLQGFAVVVGGPVSLKGGQGGQCDGAGDGGGGGGGGRFKLFYQGSQSVSGTISLGGGIGGPGGDTAPGQPGAAGSSHTGPAAIEPTSVSLGPEIVL
jgi:hypothetical protein